MVVLSFLTQTDFSILDFIAEHLRCGFLDRLMPALSKLADGGLIPILLALVLLAIPKTRRVGLAMGISFLLGLLFGNLILKNLVARPRPYQLNPSAVLLIPALSDYSFPSGHTLVVFETAVVLLKKGRGAAGVFALVMAVGIAFSRLYLYVHYPSDVLAGVLMGSAFGLIGCFLADKASDWLAERKKKG